MVGVKGFQEFLESSTIHGLSYIADNRRLVRLLWICVVTAGFTGSFIMIQQSFSSWAKSPITTTIETRPITEIDFPNVTVCPPRGSLTSLNPDLVRSRYTTFDEKKRKELSDYVPYAAYDVTYKASNGEYEEFLEGDKKYSNLYRGISKIELSNDGATKIYDLFTTAPNGSFSTPYFGEPNNKSLGDCGLDTWVNIYVPENLTVGSKIIVNLDYDVNDDDDFYINLEGIQTKNSSVYSLIKKGKLDKTTKKTKKIFNVAENSSEAMLVLLPLLYICSIIIVI